MQMDALESRQIDSDACRLLLLLCKRHHRNICSHFPEPFKLSVATAAEMLGYSRHSDKTAERAIAQLTAAKYLVKTGVTGCPPTQNYLVSDYRKPTGIESCSVTGIKSGQVTAIHISSSFQEGIESNGSNSRNGGSNGSLRSKGTNGESMAAPPAALKKGTDEERKRVAEDLAAFRSSLKQPLARALPRRADDDAGRKQAFKKGKK